MTKQEMTYYDDFSVKTFKEWHNGILITSYKYDKNGNVIYTESLNGWAEQKFDENNNIIELNTSDGAWHRWTHDINGNVTFHVNNKGEWKKTDYNEHGLNSFTINHFGEWSKNIFDAEGRITGNSHGSVHPSMAIKFKHSDC